MKLSAATAGVDGGGSCEERKLADRRRKRVFDAMGMLERVAVVAEVVRVAPAPEPGSMFAAAAAAAASEPIWQSSMLRMTRKSWLRQRSGPRDDLTGPKGADMRGRWAGAWFTMTEASASNV